MDSERSEPFSRELYIDGHPERDALHRALLHVERLISDATERERRARALNQKSLSLVLLGRVGGLSELRELLVRDFWNLANGRLKLTGLPNRR